MDDSGVNGSLPVPFTAPDCSTIVGGKGTNESLCKIHVSKTTQTTGNICGDILVMVLGSKYADL